MTSRKKLVVTGAHGFVAGSVLSQAGEEWEVHAISRAGESVGPGNVRWHACDPLNRSELEQVFREVNPAAVIHTAAVADIDLCQRNQELARVVNVELTGSLAELCSHSGAKLVFCSTDTVFDGEHAPYQEDDLPDPVNFYAETKIAAEKLVAGLGAGAVIARLSLVFGLPLLGAGNSFLPRMLASLKQGLTVAMSTVEVRTPVDIVTVGRALLELAAGQEHGVFHLAGLTRVNRFDMARQIGARFGFSESLIEQQPAAASPGRAPRPRDVSLGTGKTTTRVRTPLRTLEDGLSLILSASPGIAAVQGPAGVRSSGA
jgi:dTDP-4-dehydrorhamnose reductase